MTSPQGSARDKLSSWHDGTKGLAINNTRTRRILTRLAVRLTTLLRPKSRNGACIFISKNIIVKTDFLVHLQEAAAMKFVTEHAPSVPLPKVHCAFVHKNHAYIVMERIHGESLANAWTCLASDQHARDKIFDQLRRIVDELRALPPPPDAGVQSCNGGPLRDSRNSRAFPEFGPFRTVHDFHIWLRDNFQTSKRPENWQGDEQTWLDLEEMAAMQDGPWPAPVFTHGDLSPDNIMIRGDEVVGIIDWEFAGWYPVYWEYTSAWTARILDKGWQGAVSQFLKPHFKALKMERTRQRWWGEI
ncbi:hypothetical protein RB595_010637 [Gaeumannomyces hyphopodioides]